MPGLFAFCSQDNSGLSWYYFPFITGDEKRIFHLNRSGATIQDIDHMYGSYLTMGTSPMQPGYAEISLTFDFLPPWLMDTNNLNKPGGYGTGQGALDSAIGDFFAKVVSGGLGILIDRYQNTPTTLQTRASYAILTGDITVTRFTGGTHATLETTIILPTGRWALNSTDPNSSTKIFAY
jgi:hypothetical protein